MHDNLIELAANPPNFKNNNFEFELLERIQLKSHTILTLDCKI